MIPLNISNWAIQSLWGKEYQITQDKELRAYKIRIVLKMLEVNQ